MGTLDEIREDLVNDLVKIHYDIKTNHYNPELFTKYKKDLIRYLDTWDPNGRNHRLNTTDLYGYYDYEDNQKNYTPYFTYVQAYLKDMPKLMKEGNYVGANNSFKYHVFEAYGDYYLTRNWWGLINNIKAQCEQNNIPIPTETSNIENIATEDILKKEKDNIKAQCEQNNIPIPTETSNIENIATEDILKKEKDNISNTLTFLGRITGKKDELIKLRNKTQSFL